MFLDMMKSPCTQITMTKANVGALYHTLPHFTTLYHANFINIFMNSF